MCYEKNQPSVESASSARGAYRWQAVCSPSLIHHHDGWVTVKNTLSGLIETRWDFCGEICGQKNTIKSWNYRLFAVFTRFCFVLRGDAIIEIRGSRLDLSGILSLFQFCTLLILQIFNIFLDTLFAFMLCD